MASTHKHIRSSTANKRPTTAIADGQIALNTNSASPGLFFKDSTGATIIKIGPVHVGATAPNASPAAGGSAGNSSGEVWLDISLTPVGVKIWNGSAWVNATPIGSTTVQGLLELATSAETQAGTDTDRAVTPAGLQSKVSDSTSTTSSTTIASSTAVKAAYDLANAALPKAGGTITGNLEIGTTGSLSFEGSTADAFETTIAVTDPTADRTITLPDTTGTVVTTGDTGTVTSTMIANGTIVDADINSAAAIAHSKLASLTSANILLGNASNVATSTAVTGDVTISNTGVTAIASGVIVDADINASAAIADTKLATISTAGKVNGTALTGTIPSAVLGNSSTFVGTTSIALNRSSANQALTGISSVALPGSTSGTVTVQPTAIAGTTTITLPATTGTVVTTGDSGTVTSTMIADGTIVNGDINASAAIAGTKISPDFGSQTVQTTGIFSHALGTAAAPTVTFTGDTNTGIYSPGADQVAISTNGTGRLFVDSSGQVGVGTGSPTYKLNVNGSSYVFGLDGAGTSRIAQAIRNTGGQLSVGLESSVGGQLFTGGSAYSTCIGSDNATSLHFGTNGTVRATIDSSGRLGVGTTSPGYLVTAATSADGVDGVSVESPSSNGVIRLRADGTNGNAIRVGGVGAQGNTLRFLVGGDTERMRIDSSGRLLVGTSTAPTGTLSANSLFHVRGNTASSSGGAQLNLSSNQTSAGLNGWGGTYHLGRIIFTDTQAGEYAHITCTVDTNNAGVGSYPGRLVFSTTVDGASSPTERMRIDNIGRIGINTSPISFARLHVASDSDSYYPLVVDDVKTGTASATAVYFRRNTALVGTISTTNTATAYNTSSDYRLKENVTAVNDGITRLQQLKPSRFNFIADPDRTVDGFIAHEVQAVVPEAITGEKDAVDDDGNPIYQGIDQSKLVPLLTAALQEAIGEIESLKARVAALEAA